MATAASSGASVDLSQVPAAMPPPGIVSDFNNPDNYKHQNIILNSVVPAVTTIAIIIRLYTRAVIKKSIWVDDWFAILSWALALEFSIIMAYASVWGFGMHIYDIRATEILNTLKWLIVSQKSYFPLILSIKLCVLLGYLRIFKIDRVMNWTVWFGVIACTIFYVVTFFIDIFRCSPVEAEWNPTVEGKCMNYAAFPWATGIFNVISDFYILLLPLPLILRLNMRLAQRLRIVSIFGLGIFTCVASIMRFVVSLQYAQDQDQTYVAAKVLYWTVLEINIGLICGCAVAFPPFFDAATPRSLGSLVGSLLPKGSRSETNVASPPRTCAGWDLVVKTLKAGQEETSLNDKWVCIVSSGGGLGHLAVQFARGWGLSVVGVVLREEMVKRIDKHGIKVLAKSFEGLESIGELEEAVKRGQVRGKGAIVVDKSQVGKD